MKATSFRKISLLLLVASCSSDSHAPPVSTGELDQAATTDPPPPDPERVGWPQDVAVSIDRGCAEHGCRTTALAIDVTSLRRDDVAVQLYLAADGLDGRTARIRGDGLRDGETFALRGGERRRFVVDAGAVPIQPVGSLASARAEIVVTAGDVTVGAASSPVAYEHDSTFRTIVAYDDEGALERGGRLEPSAIERPTGRVWSGTAFVDISELRPGGGAGFTIGAGATLWGTDDRPVLIGNPPPSGTHVCFDLKLQYVDAGVGEDILNAPPSGGTPAIQFQNASYMRAWLTKSNVIGTIWDGYLNSSGCTPYQSLSGIYTLHVQSQFEKPVSGGTAHHDVKLHGVTDQVVQWTRSFIVFSPAPSQVDLQASANDHTMNVSGVVARMYVGSDTMVPAGTHTTFVDKGCPGLNPPTDSCFSGSVFIGPGAAPAPPQSMAKFLVAHEHGHFVQGNRFSLFGFNYNAVIDPLGACRCDHVVSANQLHCMQSLEQYAAALIEGYAHFYAAKLYNNRFETDCEFGYYKEVFILFGVLSPTVPIACRSDFNWRDAHCTAIANSAVEMDILRFLWDLYSVSPDRLSMDEIADLLQAAQTHAGFGALDWSDIQFAAAQVFGNPSTKYSKVLNQASLHAVD